VHRPQVSSPSNSCLRHTSSILSLPRLTPLYRYLLTLFLVFSARRALAICSIACSTRHEGTLLPHVMTGNGGPAVSLPATPQHLRPGAAIDDQIRSLEQEWRLGLRIRGAQWSPERLNNNDTADKIYALVKFLFYRAPTALEQAITEFRDRAPHEPHPARLALLRQILYSTKEGELATRGRKPKNEPPKSLAASLSSEYIFAFYILIFPPIVLTSCIHAQRFDLITRRVIGIIHVWVSETEPSSWAHHRDEAFLPAFLPSGA
jgi:hypothetical protein